MLLNLIIAGLWIMTKTEKKIENIFSNEVSEVDILLTYLSEHIDCTEILQNILEDSIMGEEIVRDEF